MRAQLEGNGKGGPELANMGNQLAVGEYPSFESHPLHYSTPLAHCSTECYPLSPQPVNGKACTQTHVQYREAQAQHSRVGPWWVLVWASYCPAVDTPPQRFHLYCPPISPSAPPIYPCLHNIQVIPCFRRSLEIPEKQLKIFTFVGPCGLLWWVIQCR